LFQLIHVVKIPPRDHSFDHTMNTANLLRLFLLAALWGGSFLFMRIAAPVLGAVPTAFGRVVLGALGLLGLVAVMKLPARFDGKFKATLMLGVINSGIPFLMFSLAARSLPAGYSAILNATTPLMGVVIGALAFGEQLTWSKAAGVFVGLVGVAVLTRAGPVAFAAATLWGVAACLVATACYGLAGFLTKRWITQRGGLDSRIVALGSQLGAVLLLLPFATWDAASHPVAWSEVSSQVWLSMLVLGLLCTSLAYVLYFKLIAEVGPMKALTVTFLIPLFGVLWGALVLGESATMAHAVGGGLIGAALWLVLRPAPIAAASQKTT
jgi:drug/metabolite transporter (DMT)-like permease